METCKIITMPAPNTLSDEDLYNLFMGVLKMIRRYATNEQIERLVGRLRENDLS